jgi:hypothetical protein
VNAIQIHPSSVTIESNFNPANLTFTGGVLQGAGDLTISDALDWSGGTMTGSGRTIVAAEEWMATEASIGATRFTVLALPPDSALLSFRITEGRGLRPDDTNAIVINTKLAAAGAILGGAGVSGVGRSAARVPRSSVVARTDRSRRSPRGMRGEGIGEPVSTCALSQASRGSDARRS